ncbi:MAG: sterol desaturase family protein [Paracoccaceae bacterium]
MNDDASMLRLVFFVGVLLVMAVLERVFPRRDRLISTPYRWTNNLGLMIVNSTVMRLVIPISLIWFADQMVLRQWGLFNILDLPYWLSFVASLIILDLAIYFQHRLFHAVPVLWRLHRLHHADLDMDVTTGLRFHPIEILLSMGIKFALVVLFGVPAAAVLVFEVVLNGMSIFNHANFNIPAALDKKLRVFIATPDYHRVHHSVRSAETNSNFGFNLSLWDRLFGTYQAQPEAGHETMTIGLNQFRETRDLRLDRMLWQPVRSNSNVSQPKEKSS